VPVEREPRASRYRAGMSIWGMSGHVDFDDQPTIGRIPCADRPLVNGDGALGDREAQAGAIGIPVGYPAEWQEDLGKHAFRDSRTVIADAKQRSRITGFERDLNGGSFRSVPDGITHDIFHGAAQQFFEAIHGARVGLIDDDAATARAGLEIAITGDFLHQVREVEGRRRASIDAAVDSRQR